MLNIVMILYEKKSMFRLSSIYKNNAKQNVQLFIWVHSFCKSYNVIYTTQESYSKW